TSLWATAMGADQRTTWQPVIETAVIYAGEAFQNDDLKPGLSWLSRQAEEKGASRAYLLDYARVLTSSAQTHLAAETTQQLTALIEHGLDALAEDDPALALLMMPNLFQPIIETLQRYSPYWQIEYQRRSATAIAADVRALVGFLADELTGINEGRFLTAVDMQRHYLMHQGICTAYYQQLIDLAVEVLRPLLDEDSAERATVALEAANAALESENPLVLAMADRQDEIVTFVIDHLQKNHADWVNNYPGGWDDATTDMYYWLGYLTDALTFNHPEYLAAHVGWLYDYGRQRSNTGDHIRVSLIALGHGVKNYLPDHARSILGVMQGALARLPQTAG
ncbi:MAG: hypothetical protein GYB67_15375, partial [Chloroflexi bacterium]|nr:hypothetical protein [Chloroflexota bacterium]